jgi:undecaprenyl-diphosphatase
MPSSVRSWISTVDAAVDNWFEPYRGRPAVDAAAKVVANLSDHGVVWALDAAWRARRPGPERRRVIRQLAIAGFGSSLVNAALKSAITRPRPDRSALNLRAGQVPVREPTSSSFPSGHTLAAFCTATVMADRRRPVVTGVRFAAAGLVGLSRIHLRAHHASDVVGGMAVGLAVGALGRPFR